MRRTLAMLVFVVMLWVPVLTIAAEPGAKTTQEIKTRATDAKTEAPPQTDSATKSDRSDVEARGLFQKKKKKQVGGSAGHSQPSDRTDPPTQEGLVIGK